MSITSTELILCGTIWSLVRNSSGQEFNGDIATTMNVLCLVNDHIDNDSFCCFKKYANIGEMLKLLDAYSLHNSAIMNNTIQLLTFSSIDEMITFINNCSSLFRAEDFASPNNLIAPFQICSDSIIGIFLRYFLACWNTMTFEDICKFYENFMEFMSSDDNHGYDNSYRPMDMKMNWSFEAQNESLNEMDVDTPYLPYIDRIDDNDIDRVISVGDMINAEKLIHATYDQSGSKIIHPHCRANDQTNIANALRALKESSLKDSINSIDRHQHAMLRLASAWGRNKYYDQALTASEEAIKIAHQKGDHATIAKTLLLANQILMNAVDQQHSFHNDENMEYGTTVGLKSDDDELLCRCLERCVTSKLYHLSAQATLLLARSRSRQDLVGFIDLNMKASGNAAVDHIKSSVQLTKLYSAEIASAITNGREYLNCDGKEILSTYLDNFRPSARRSVADDITDENDLLLTRYHEKTVQSFWALLSSVILGDIRLSSNLARGGIALTVKRLSESTIQRSNAINPLQKTNKSDSVISLMNVLYNQSNEQAAALLGLQMNLIAIDFWCRLGMTSMAVLQARRSIVQYGGKVDIHTEELIMTYCELASLLVESSSHFVNDLLIFSLTNPLYADHNPSLLSSSDDYHNHIREGLKSCKISLQMMAMIESTTNIHHLSVNSRNKITGTKLFLHSKQNALLLQLDLIDKIVMKTLSCRNNHHQSIESISTDIKRIELFYCNLEYIEHNPTLDMFINDQNVSESVMSVSSWNLYSNFTIEKKLIITSVEAAKIRMISALFIAQYDYDESRLQLLDTISQCIKIGIPQCTGEALALYNIILLYRAKTTTISQDHEAYAFEIREAIIALDRITKNSKLMSFSSVAILIEQAITILLKAT
jgi:hypothetical protein